MPKFRAGQFCVISVHIRRGNVDKQMFAVTAKQTFGQTENYCSFYVPLLYTLQTLSFEKVIY